MWMCRSLAVIELKLSCTFPGANGIYIVKYITAVAYLRLYLLLTGWRPSARVQYAAELVYYTGAARVAVLATTTLQISTHTIVFVLYIILFRSILF